MVAHPQKPPAQAFVMSDFGNNLKPIRSVSIIGAGVMGCAIAAANMRAGVRVRITDINAARANDAVDRLLAKQNSISDLTASQVNETALPMIRVATDESEIAEADLIIEAVAEHAATKIAVLSHIESYLHNDTLIATNSSSIPITQLASSLKTPGRFCGMHFCHPVHQRPLVEVVGATVTSDATIHRASKYAAAIGMAPIVVRDSPGFLLNRLLVPYLNEAIELLLDGASVGDLDQAAIDFGMPIGPLAHFDDFGIDIALAVGRTLYLAFPERIVPSELLIRMYKAGRLGRKSGSGFYSTPLGTGIRQLDPEVCQMISERQRCSKGMTSEEIKYRLFLPMLLEAYRVLDEHLVESSTLIDRVLQDGLGMTESYRGLFAWADVIGATRLLELLQPLRSLGKRFEPGRSQLSVSSPTEPTSDDHKSATLSSNG